MAGSYQHVVTDTGQLRSNERVIRSLETGGDVFEAVEEMYGMIWFLAATFGAPAAPPSEVKAVVESARRNYEKGLKIAKEVNRRA